MNRQLGSSNSDVYGHLGQPPNKTMGNPENRIRRHVDKYVRANEHQNVCENLYAFYVLACLSHATDRQPLNQAACVLLAGAACD